ncbi:MAG: NAD(+) diphosphatase [Alphaproteobacteria bacterium]|nr:NAD(+) diphosphatase [Alphaproteobacteria bacterium]
MKSANFYGETGLNRMAERRTDSAWLQSLAAGTDAVLIPIWRTRNLIAQNANNPEAVRLSALHINDILDDKSFLIFLGYQDGVPHFSIDLSHMDEPHEHPALKETGEFTDIRDIGLDLPREDGGLLAYSRAIAQWHKTHRFCGRCGHPSVPRDGGHMRLCTNANCKTQHFPRTDMAVIMLVSSGDKIILGRKKEWSKDRFSILAGFVEPGETLEGAVAREVMEEVGIPITNVRYHSSQPWPFPSNLMLGFFAEAESETINITDDELAEARWFTREELLDEANAYAEKPHSVSIARRLIAEWALGIEP